LVAVVAVVVEDLILQHPFVVAVAAVAVELASLQQFQRQHLELPKQLRLVLVVLVVLEL
jgi:hypothetical protein